ncbi:MAG: hypothetical protein NTX88_00795 [Candidatus Atribacteria bacterium]|nr:hypothetical protein [Candidatus Atribacteria bacterium]
MGRDQRLNEIKKFNQAFFTLFETIPDQDIAFLLFDAAKKWAVERGFRSLIGPVSPTNGDDWRGLLIDGFEQEPYVFTSYNPSHYQELYMAK